MGEVLRRAACGVPLRQLKGELSVELLQWGLGGRPLRH